MERFLEKVGVKGDDECWGWLGYKNANGYGCFQSDLAHRVSYRIFVGEIPNKMCVLHRCDNPGCCNYLHLFLGTRVDNIFDMIKKKRDRHLFGEQHGRAKLTNKDAAKIKLLLKEGLLSQDKIAEMFGITQCVVSDINLNRIWRNV
jgi:predicted XRE-type DNA-binding protein